MFLIVFAMKGVLFAPFQTKCEANENITPVGKSKANRSFWFKAKLSVPANGL